MADSDTAIDLAAGWTGGIAGILVSNPLEVVKVRLQTAQYPTPSTSSAPLLSSSRSPVAHSSSLALQYALPVAPAAPSPTTPLEWLKDHSCHHLSVDPNDIKGKGKALGVVGNPNPLSAMATVRQLWRQEGYRFLFAGAAAPIVGLAFIDSFFFATYGRCMSGLSQDRQDPSSLGAVFLSGATAGGVSALLQTPIEVVKCRAQAEPLDPRTGEKAGSFEISRRIAKGQGLRGFYIGGLTTGVRDSLSSGIFFASYIMFRRALRGEAVFTSKPSPASGSSSDPAEQFSAAGDWRELARILLAGGLAGSLSAIIPYPLDIVKTRLQVSKVSATASSSPSQPSSSTSPASQSSHSIPTSVPSSLRPRRPSQPTTFREVVRQIHSDGRAALLPPFGASAPSLSPLSNTRTYRLLTLLWPTSLPANRSLRRAAGIESMTTTTSVVSIPAERWASRLLGLGAFFRGLKPTIASSFAGSAVTIAVFEVMLDVLSRSKGVKALAGAEDGRDRRTRTED